MEQSNTPLNQLIKKTLQVSFSVGMTRFVQMLTVFIGMIMVARLGCKALAASAYITSIQGVIFMMGASLITAVGIMAAQGFGAKNIELCAKSFRNGLALAFALSIVVVLILLNVNHLLFALGQPKAVVEIAQQYFNAYVFAAPIFMFVIVMQQFVIAVDRKRLVVIMSFLGLFIIPLLSYCMIFGKLGFPHFGIQGLAFAYTAWAVICLSIYIFYIVTNSYFKKYALFSPSKGHGFFELQFIKKLLNIGLPIALQSVSDLLSFLALTIIVGWLGSTDLAVQQIVNQYFLLLVLPILSLSQTSSILLSQAYGAKNKADISRYANVILCIGLLFSSIIMLLFILLPHQLIVLYAGYNHGFNPKLLSLATMILILTGSRIWLDTIIEIKIGSLRGILDVRFPMLLSIIMAWLIGIPLAYVFCFSFNWGLIGITIAGIISMLISAIILSLRWRYQSNAVVFESTSQYKNY
ncbi:MATE family efflux transporter [Cysteiniphilum halobium]|uniref:MATE family efflux transporter n=1 Tax=Cysteiniphilum halobium TaxID=2219059 RepID=UPI000E652D8E|nr:MATE family efflux transporter [Cysteiniphilum halobium]